MSRFASVTLAEAVQRPHNNFGLIRLLLALAVVISHAFSVTTGVLEDEPLAASTGFTLGEHAVNGFFAISGFLVTMSFERRGWRDYTLSRLLRIAPGLIAATLVVSLLIGGAMTDLGLRDYLSDPRLWRFIERTLTTFKSAAALPGVFETNPLQFPMGTVWTLKYETLCYLGVFLLGIAGLLARREWLLAAGIVLTLATIAEEAFGNPDVKALETALRLPLIFLAGGLAYLYREKLRIPLISVPLLLLVLVPLAWTPLYKAALYLATAWSVLVLAFAPALTSRRTEPSADLSYGVYLYGWPVQQALHALMPGVAALTLLWPSLTLTLIIAAASWYWVEKPALRIKRRLLMRSRVQPEAARSDPTSGAAAG